MEAGKGYWIKMTSSDNLTITGAPPSTSLTLTEGWNLVGYNNTASASSSSALGSISNKYQIVWAYMNSQWKGYDPSDAEGSDLTEFTCGYGYWDKGKRCHYMAAVGQTSRLSVRGCRTGVSPVGLELGVKP